VVSRRREKCTAEEVEPGYAGFRLMRVNRAPLAPMPP